MDGVKVAGHLHRSMEVRSVMSKERIATDRDFDRSFTFVSYDVKVRIESNCPSLLNKARILVGTAFGDKATIIENARPVTDHVFGIVENQGVFELFKNGSFVSSGASERNFFKYLNSVLRLEVGEFVEEKVFMHAGVVGLNGKALVFPAISFSGKSTLTAELVKQGAEYYSDEYAVFEPNGNVGNFPRPISLRDPGTTRETDVTVEELGGRVGKDFVPVGMVLFTSFSRGARWDPEVLSPGAAIMEMIPHTLTIRRNPAFSLKVLDLVAQRAIILKSPRGDVKKFAKFLLAFFDNHTKLAKMT